MFSLQHPLTPSALWLAASDRLRDLTVPTFVLPGFVAAAGRLLPQWPHAMALTTALNTAARFQVLPKEGLSALEGKRFVVCVGDAGLTLRFAFEGGHFRPLSRFSTHAPADLTLTANASAFMQLLLRQEDPDTLFFSRRLTIEGDTELGLIVKNMLDAIEWPSNLTRLSATPRK
jgi:predicted lipid carrier protein YhbT